MALYGAGAHTRCIKDHLTHTPVEIVGILDDNEDRQGSHLGPFRIYHPRALERLDVDAVVLSSDEWEDQMWSRRGIIEQQGIPVWRLYGSKQPPLESIVRCASVRP